MWLTPGHAWKNKYRQIPWDRNNLEKYRDTHFWSYRPALTHTVLKRSLSVVCFGSCYFCVSVQPLCDVISICQINEIFVRLSWQPPVAPLTLPMAPPSPSTNSSTNNSSSSSSTTGWEQLSKTNLYIRGLPPGTTDHDLAKICQPWVLAVMS